MRLLVIDDNYPAEDNLYGDVFAHVRVKEYIKTYPRSLVAAHLSSSRSDYNYEGVQVKCVGSIEGLVELVTNYRPDIILIHFATFPMIRQVVFKFNLPYIIWVHGFEALAWYRRLFNLKDPIHFLRYIKGNLIQLYYFRKLIKRSNDGANIRFVFVSEWMRKTTETDCFIKVKKHSIIPNPINDTLFNPQEKPVELRKNLLMIRPFDSKKYGTDIVTKAMQKLRAKTFFKDLHFTIYGNGSTQSEMFRLFGKDDNVIIKDGFLTQREIRELHKQNGIFISVTRQDAQGVSMCEAMSSGLVVITSNNTAIPEFVQDKISGMVTDNDPETVANVIEELYRTPEKFREVSGNASASIIKKAGIEAVIKLELQLIESAARKKERTNLISE
jgi:glycosyltransferase involved in cell wall biosynthesis